MERTDGVSDLIDSIKENRAEQAKLIHKLERSLALRKLCGDWLKFPCKSWMQGTPSSGLFLYVKSADGEEKSYRIGKLPKVLLQAHEKDLIYAARWSNEVRRIVHTFGIGGR